MRSAKLLLAAVLLAGLGLAAPARADAPVRLPMREFGSQFYSLTVRFDSGHHLFAEIAVSNIGLGDANAAALGALIEPDGTVHAFRKVRGRERWELSDDRLRLRIDYVELDQRGPVTRFLIERKNLKVDLSLRVMDAPAAPAALAGPEHGFSLLAFETETEGSIWMEGDAAPTPLRGRGTLSQRWMERLESRVTARRIEVFSSDGDERVHLVMPTDPDGSSRPWLTVADADGMRFAGPVALELDWPAQSATESAPYALPNGLRLRGDGIEGRVVIGDPLHEAEPLGELPIAVRATLHRFLRWHSTWANARVTLRLASDGEPADRADRGDGGDLEPLTIEGGALANVTHFAPEPLVATTPPASIDAEEAE